MALGVALAMVALIWLSLASAASGAGDAADAGTPATQPDLSTEVVSQRTPTSQTFELPDGKRLTRIYESPVFYRDGEGDLRPVESELKETAAGTIVNGDNTFDLRLPEDLGTEQVRLASHGWWVSQRLEGLDPAAADLRGATALYGDAGSEASVEMSGLPNGLKETLELAGPDAPSTFDYVLDASPGLEPSLNEDGSIDFRDGEGQVVATLPAPYMFDSAPAPVRSQDVHYELSSREDGSWSLAVIADPEWLEDEARVYPVSIDPTIVVPEPALDCEIGYNYWASWGQCGASGHQSLDTLLMPAEYTEWLRGLLRFDLSAIPASAEITAASVSLYSPSAAQNTEGVELRRVTKSWTSAVTWTKYDGTNKWGPGKGGGDYSSEGSEILTSERGSAAGWWDFTEGITPLVSDWFSGTIPNQGLVLKLKDDMNCIWVECEEIRSVEFRSSAATDQSKRPHLDVTYVPPPPVCQDGNAQTEEGEPLVLEPGALECEGEGPLEYEIVSGPEHGEISGFNPETGALTYTPDSEFTGLDSFTFKAADGVGSSAAKDFNIAVGKLAVCQDGEASTPGGHPLVLEAGALECEGQAPLTYEIVSGPEHGEISEFDPETGALVYTPNPEFSGADSFTFRAVNGLGSSPVQSFAITVQPVPICHNGASETPVNQPLVLEAGALECEGPLEYEIVTGPKHGEISSFTAATGALTYVPDSGYAGLDSFKFAARNEAGLSAPKFFAIQVGEFPGGKGLVAAYSFDEGSGENARDVVGGHDGVVVGANWVQGKYGPALKFDNEDGESEGVSVVQVPDTPALDLTESLTVEAWVRPRVLSDYAPVLTKARGLYEFSYMLSAGGYEWGVPAAYISHKDTEVFRVNGSGELPPETWSHLAMSYDGELMRLYVDGALVDTQPSAAPHPDDHGWNDGWLNIGIGPSSGSTFDGKIDEVRIYNRALSGAEISTNMLVPIEGVEGSEDPEEPEEPGECELPQLHVSGSAADEEAPGVALNVWATPGNPQCAEHGELARLAEVNVSIDEEVVFSESRNCEGPNDPCGPGFGRTIQLPYEKLLGSHQIEVSGKDQQDDALEALSYPEETLEEGTVARAPTEAEASTSSEDCSTPRNRGDRSPKNPHGYRIEIGVLYGTPCADIIGTHEKVHVYYGMKGNDVIRAGAKTKEVILGGDGNDTVFGGRGTDVEHGGSGADRLDAGTGDDRLRGQDGNDTLIGGPGEDKIFGENGDDLVRGGTTVDTLSGGEGHNTLSYADGTTPGFEADPEAGNENEQTAVVPNFPERGQERGVYINLSGDPAVIGDDSGVARFGGGTDNIVNAAEFQDVIGTPFADLIIGSSDANRIDAGAGTDIVRGGPGNDAIYGGADSDYLDGEGGSDGLHGGEPPGSDTCVGGGDGSCEGTSAEAGVETPSTTSISVGVLEPDVGSEGADVYLRGSEGADSVTAEWSSGEVHFTAEGEGTGRFNTENDGVSGCEVSATKATCPISGPNTIVISGGPGPDVLKALEFPTEIAVTLLGGEGSDVLSGGNHSEDALVDGPGAGEDRLFGNGEDDAMFENDGADLLNGGAGNDLFVSSTVCDGDTIRGGGGSDNANWAQLVEGEVEDAHLRWDQAPYNHPEHGVEAQIANGAGKGSLDREGGSCANEGEIFKVENLEGSHGPDVLTGNNDENVLLGRSGKDVLRGLGDDDLLLANNRDPDGKTEQELKDPDEELNCGGGHDVLKRDPADSGHFKNCERHHPAKGAESSVPGVGSDPGYTPEVQVDEEAIGSATDPEAVSPTALYRLDETSGEVAPDWTDEESETAGAYEGGVELDQPGALAESQSVHLDGANDYLDLTSNWDPISARANTEPCDTAGYSVEMWVKFDSSAEGREVLFSRSAGAKGIELYRSPDGRLNFTVLDSVESPTTRTDDPVSDSEWHHVVATLEEPVECEGGGATLTAVHAFGPAEETEFEPPVITLYVDGFSFPLGTPFAFPAATPLADNLVGAANTAIGPTDFLEGEVDDVAIYDEALSEIDVASHLASSDVEPAWTILAPPIDTTDSDEDEVPDSVDNCPEASNPGQEDSDLDGVGDACQTEPDEDEDGITDEVDNCPEVPNSEQIDSDENGVGDACEPE